MVRTLKITTKYKAEDMRVNSLFTQGGTLKKMRYDGGKYKADSVFTGKDIEVTDDVVCVWSEKRKDNDGFYRALFCLVA